jgi:DNA-binding transcriptional MerR regulator
MSPDIHLSPGETAERFGVTIKALRLYETRGLLRPVRSDAGWRLYGPDQIARLHQILALKSLGLSLSRIGELLNGPDMLQAVLAMQEQALAQDSEKLSRALRLVRAARAKLESGQTLSIDDLATLTKEASMVSRLTRPTLFHPALAAHQHKYFRPDELTEMAAREDYDQERDFAEWDGLIAELKQLALAGDPACPQALDLGRRWEAQIEAFTKGNEILTTRLRNMAKDAFSDPVTARQMPYSVEELFFLGQILENCRN